MSCQALCPSYGSSGQFLWVCVSVGGESACGADAVRAAGDGHAAAAANRSSAADARCKGSSLSFILIISPQRNFRLIKINIHHHTVVIF